MLEFENCEIIKNVDKCPNIFVKIQGIKTDALIDTGSEITCISENFFEDNKNKLKNCKILPIVGTSVVGATGIHDINMEPIEDSTNIDPQDFANKTNFPVKYEEFINLKEYDELGEKYCIFDAEIEKKVAKCELLNSEEKKNFWEVLKKYKDIFSKKPGRLSIYEHELKIKYDKPFIIKTYPIPMRLRELVTAELNKLLELGIIRRSNSPYINPLVTSLKKDGSVRICLDARKLNDIMIND